jgi:hypothetical protein
MLNYTVRRWPLWRVLLAQSLTIAVALVIELGMMGQGRAQCSDVCKKGSISRLEHPPACEPGEYGEIANFLDSAGLGLYGQLASVVVRESMRRSDHHFPETVSKKDKAKIVTGRVDQVWKLSSNRILEKNGRTENCICGNDEVCFPKKKFDDRAPPSASPHVASPLRLRSVSQHVPHHALRYVLHQVRSGKARVCKSGNIKIKVGEHLDFKKRRYFCDHKGWYWLKKVKVYEKPRRH